MHSRRLWYSFFFFFNDTATTEIYTLSLHDALPIWCGTAAARRPGDAGRTTWTAPGRGAGRPGSARLPGTARGRSPRAGRRGERHPACRARARGVARGGAAAGLPERGAPRLRPAPAAAWAWGEARRPRGRGG